MPDDFRVSITNAPGKDAYPISSFTWLLIPEKIAESDEEESHQGFSEVDADRRADYDCGSRLRTASQGGSGEGNESDREDSIADDSMAATPTTLNPSAGPAKPAPGYWQRLRSGDEAAYRDHLHGCGRYSGDHRPAGVGVIQQLRRVSQQIRLEFPVHFQPGTRSPISSARCRSFTEPWLRRSWRCSSESRWASAPRSFWRNSLRRKFPTRLPF